MEIFESGPRDFPRGLWLPLVTPFQDGALDETSLRRLLRHYAAQPIDGLILAATTGEGLTLSDAETETLVRVAPMNCRRPGGACRSSSAFRAAIRAGCWRRWTARRPGRSTAL